jgi:hypothetical protein
MTALNPSSARIAAPTRPHPQSRSVRCCAFALALCFGLAACQPQQDVRVLFHAAQPLAHDCLEALPGHLTSQMPLAQIRRPRPQQGVEYEVRGPESRISVFQDFDTDIIEVALTLEGRGSPAQQRDSLGVLKDVQRAVLAACNLDSGKVRIERSCAGDICKDPAY